MHYRDEFYWPQERLFRAGRHGRRGSVGAMVIVLAVAAVAAGGSWLWFRWRTPRQPPPAAGPMSAAPAPAPGAEAPPPAPALELPQLDASDQFVRDLVVHLSDHPALARWLVSDDLVRRCVAAVVTIAHGGSPVQQVEFLRPRAAFQVVRSGGRLVAAPASYRRYALITETLVSLHTEAAARLYSQLEPLFDQAYHEMGFADSSFTVELTRAMRSLIAVEVPREPAALVPSDSGGTYAFADPALETRTPAEKQLLRLGPDNARRVQAKLAELLPLISR